MFDTALAILEVTLVEWRAAMSATSIWRCDVPMQSMWGVKNCWVRDRQKQVPRETKHRKGWARQEQLGSGVDPPHAELGGKREQPFPRLHLHML